MNYSDDECRHTVGQSAAIFFVGFVLSLCFALPIFFHREKITFCQTGKLNPNTASVYELAELPSLGPAKARAILEYRQNNEKDFESANDIEKVKGIGKKTVENIKQWLVFDNDTD